MSYAVYSGLKNPCEEQNATYKEYSFENTTTLVGDLDGINFGGTSFGGT